MLVIQKVLYVFSMDVTTEASDSLLECIMNKELFRDGDRADIRKLRTMIIRSKLNTPIKVDFLDYVASDEANAVASLRKLIYDFLSADEAIESASNYTNRQVDIALGLLLYEKSLRDSSYNDIFCRFTEIYRAKGGVL